MQLYERNPWLVYRKLCERHWLTIGQFLTMADTAPSRKNYQETLASERYSFFQCFYIPNITPTKRSEVFENTEAHSEAKRACRGKSRVVRLTILLTLMILIYGTWQPSISFTDVPPELVSNILNFSSPDDILSLGQVSHRFHQICSNPYLCRVGIIIKNGNGADIRLVGQLFSPSAIAFLRDVDLGFPRISLICDLFHASSFSSDIIRFLQNHSIQGLEMLFLEDELDILEDPSFSVIVHSILTAIPPTCKRVSFSSRGGQILRTLPTPRRTTSSPSRPTRYSTLTSRKLMESVTEFRLSSIFSRMGPLWDTLSYFQQTSGIEVLYLDCDTTEDLKRILLSITLPGLLMFSIITHGGTLPIFPTSFNKLHPKLKFLSILNFRSWNAPDPLQTTFLPLPLPSNALSHLTMTSNYSSFEIQDVTALSRLTIISFMSIPVPENREYCEVVESLTQALRPSSSSHLFSSSLTVSFTFPRFLDVHIRFCEENPIYRCSCSPRSMKGRLVKNIRNVEVQADILSEAFVVWTFLF